jgi:hypothetical protein
MYLARSDVGATIKIANATMVDAPVPAFQSIDSNDGSR